jgi:AmiR/NasT family two-component response regulator
MAQTLLKDLRSLEIAVLLPPDDDGAQVMDQLNRIGCRATAVWPPPGGDTPRADVLFAGVTLETHAAMMRYLKRAGAQRPAVIAVVDYENPAMLQLVLELEAMAVISKPVRPLGLLTNLVIARSAWLNQQELLARIRRLEAKLAGQRNIAKAKSILMEAQGIGEEAAYRTIRAQAMAKRVTIDEMAVAIINANELLSSRIDDA